MTLPVVITPKPTGQRCETCRFWLYDRHDTGACRYNAPQLGNAHGWPITLSLDWCGQWQALHGDQS
jgi:hypothetical protein